MTFYAYKGHAPLGSEGPGGEGRTIWKDLSTVKGAIRRGRSYWGDDFSLYTFSNFYDNKTFRKVYPAGVASERRGREGGGGIRSYGPGKFYTILDSLVYELVSDGFADEEASYPDGGGSFALVPTGPGLVDHVKANGGTDAEIQKVLANKYVIFFERSDGIVEASWYPTEKKAEAVWAEILKDTEGGE